jgi:D-alanine-D-alanine ligase
MSKRIVIVHDVHAEQGPPDQSDTLLEARAIAAALRENGFEPTIVPVGLDLARLERALIEIEPHAVFNLVESLAGRGRLLAAVPALVESLGLPLTGCSASALGVTSDKVLAKRLLQGAGIATPALHEEGAAGGEWIVKSLWEHASLGIDDSSIVRSRDVAATIAARAAAHGGDWFAEAFVPGRELNVSLIAESGGPRVLPVAEIRFDDFPPGKPRIVGYAAKWHADSYEYRSTPRVFGVEPALAARIGAIALDCWRLFDLGGYARVDFRVDARGDPWVLEVNANPCLSPDAGFAAALAEAGLEYRAAVAALVEDAVRRRSATERSRSGS